MRGRLLVGGSVRSLIGTVLARRRAGLGYMTEPGNESPLSNLRPSFHFRLARRYGGMTRLHSCFHTRFFCYCKNLLDETKERDEIDMGDSSPSPGSGGCLLVSSSSDPSSFWCHPIVRPRITSSAFTARHDRKDGEMGSIGTRIYILRNYDGRGAGFQGRHRQVASHHQKIFSRMRLNSNFDIDKGLLYSYYNPPPY